MTSSQLLPYYFFLRVSQDAGRHANVGGLSPLCRRQGDELALLAQKGGNRKVPMQPLYGLADNCVPLFPPGAETCTFAHGDARPTYGTPLSTAGRHSDERRSPDDEGDQRAGAAVFTLD
ncbi:hypothetical protein MRX96_002708 [Rhipicephalus microplus]